MQENTNKAIAINSLINYVKMFICTILSLFTTRFALQALGIDDFGLYSVLGSIISFIGIFNTIMVSTCNRFLSVAIGKGNTNEINKQFNVNLIIFWTIAIIMFVVAYPLGDWYVHNHINYNGPIENAMMVFLLSIVGSILSTLATPFNGLLMAKERFIVFGIVEIFSHFIRFIVAFLLLNHFEDKLLIYTLTMALCTACPLIVFWCYCRHHFQELVRWNLVRDKKLYQQVFAFSGWVSYGAIAWVARNQGAALLVNAFFNTAMNTALGLANSLNAYIMLFANNLTQPIQPQITKSYAAGNLKRTDELLIMSTKYSFMLMFLVSCPFFVSAEWLIGFWLGEVPPFLVSFMTLLIIDNLVQSFNLGIANIIFASGKIAMYQFVINTLRLLAIAVAYFVLRLENEPQTLFYTYISFSSIAIFATQWCLHKTLHYNVHNLVLKSYLPSLSIALLFLPILFIPETWHALIRIIIALGYLIILEFTIGLSKSEKRTILKLHKII